MEQTSSFGHKGFIILLSLIIITIIFLGGYYWYNDSADNSQVKVESQNSLNSSVTVAPTMPLTTSASSPVIAPLVSPILPASPLGLSANNDEVDPEVEAMIQEGISLYERQDYQAALTILDEALTRDPHNLIAHNTKASVYSALKDYDRAIAEYTQTIDLQPMFAPAFYNRGRVYGFLKKYDEAIFDFKTSSDLHPGEFGYRAYGNIGLIYHQQGKYDQALEAFAKAISFDDTKADTYYLRGQTYTAMENYELAIADYQAATSRFPNYDLAYQGLAYAYYKTGQVDQAQAALQQAMAITPNSPVSHFYQALIHLADKEADQAKSEASQAMDSIGALSEDEQKSLFTRILTELDIVTQKNPGQEKIIKEIVNLIPQP
jgi:tetratricopeptide (TPR) repeat protein